MRLRKVRNTIVNRTIVISSGRNGRDIEVVLDRFLGRGKEVGKKERTLARLSVKGSRAGNHDDNASFIVSALGLAAGHVW